jgi:type I restriction enzyme S subunit
MAEHKYNGWLTTTLAEICCPKIGIQTGPFGSQLKADEYSEIGVPVIMPKDIVDGVISDLTIARVPESKADKLKRHRCLAGDIVFGRRGEIGRCGLITEREQGWLCGSGSMRIRLSGDSVPAFFTYLFRLPQTVRWLNSNAVGQTMLNLSAGILSDLPLEVPSTSEQKKIAEILSTWDRGIHATRCLIETKQRQKRHLMQRLLSGKQRLPQFARQPWRQRYINDIAREVSLRNVNGIELPVLSCTKHRGLLDSLSYFGKRIFSKDLSTYKVVKRGHFAYATNHIEEGSIGYQNLHDTALISPMYTVFETTGDVCDGFLYKLLKTEHYRHLFEAMTSGSINRRGSLRWNEFKKIKVLVPSREEQEEIDAFGSLFEREIELLEIQRDALKKQKRGLMQQLLTGRIWVNVSENQRTRSEV